MSEKINWLMWRRRFIDAARACQADPSSTNRSARSEARSDLQLARGFFFSAQLPSPITNEAKYHVKWRSLATQTP